MPAPRVIPTNANYYNYLSLTTNKNSLLRRRPASKNTNSIYEDRRQWHPDGVYAYPKSKTQSYPTLVDYSWPSWPQDPFDPYHPLRDPFGPKIDVPYRYKGPLKTPKGHDYFVGDNPNNSLGFTRKAPLGWENPWDMLICLKRKMRREIMHALGIAGKKNFKKPRYTQFSYVRCR